MGPGGFEPPTYWFPCTSPCIRANRSDQAELGAHCDCLFCGCSFQLMDILGEFMGFEQSENPIYTPRLSTESSVAMAELGAHNSSFFCFER